MWASKPYRDAVAIQALLTESTKSAKPSDLAQMAKAFVALEMLKLRLRMKPAPKPVDVSKVGTKPQAITTGDFTED